MALIVWSEKYSVKNQLIDNQHQKLVALINDLHSAMKEGKGKEISYKVMNDLIVYTREHFNTEEGIMLKSRYALFSEHKAEHEQLTKKVIELQNDLQSGNFNLTLELLTFLRNWLINHIEKTDKKYVGKI